MLGSIIHTSAPIDPIELFFIASAMFFFGLSTAKICQMFASTEIRSQMSFTAVIGYKIKGPYDDDDKDFLYWSNKDGWVDHKSSTIFEPIDLYRTNFPLAGKLPIQIAWVDDLGETVKIDKLEKAFTRFKYTREEILDEHPLPDSTAVAGN